MARQITSQSSVVTLSSGSRSAGRRLRIALLAAFAILSCISYSRAESLASKNKKGNRLYAEGNYEEAEKAYLEAEAKDPDRPEILYNLGNALIKQNKLEEGIGALRRSRSKEDQKTEENSWFNTGNAFFLMGNFKNSSEAYIQALKLNPADKDAKHNLELALKKLEQKEQQQSQKGRNGSDSKNSAQDQTKPEKKNEQHNKKDQMSSTSGNEQKDTQPSQNGSAARPRDSLSKEQALQILDAVQDQELSEHRRLFKRRAGQESSRKDW
jgi:Ca-activated chloride channel family protein